MLCCDAAWCDKSHRLVGCATCNNGDDGDGSCNDGVQQQWWTLEVSSSDGRLDVDRKPAWAMIDGTGQAIRGTGSMAEVFPLICLLNVRRGQVGTLIRWARGRGGSGTGWEMAAEQC